jgi:hypothetical protein
MSEGGRRGRRGNQLQVLSNGFSFFPTRIYHSKCRKQEKGYPTDMTQEEYVQEIDIQINFAFKN